MTDPTTAPSTASGAAPYTTPATAARRWNGLAIVSLIAAVLALGVVAVIAGHVALRQIARTGESGRALGIAGLVLGYLEIVAGAVLVVLWVFVLSTGSLVVTR